VLPKLALTEEAQWSPQASPARAKEQQHKLNARKIKSVKPSLLSPPFHLRLFLLPTEVHLIIPLENFAQTSIAVNIAPFLTDVFPRSHQKQSPSHAADQVTLSAEKGQDWNDSQTEDKQRRTSPRDHLFRSSGPELSGEVKRHVYMTYEDLRQNFNEDITADDSTCVKHLSLSPFI